MSPSSRDATEQIRRLLALDKSGYPSDGGERFNRLIFESSPYLLQHAENPVNWYPWGEEAFAAARREDKPVFLSIGYATCHWCHVMEHESFEDPDVAAVINRHFIPVKVDREERPDIDDQYMLVSQMMTGSGGWPLNIVMTPGREPFFAITYMPNPPRMGLRGIREIMENIATLWRTRRELVQQNCAAVMEGIAAMTAPKSGSGERDGLSDSAWGHLQRMYDPEHGGFGGAPKFPMPHYLSFLLLRSFRTGESAPLRMAGHSLESMRRGGVCDQLGYGFHRYSVDGGWLVPHFEKMLYDQALIGGACLDAFRRSGEQRYREMAEEILAFVAADLTAQEGGFFAALDADSEGVEGKCYLWAPAEVRALLGAEDSGLFCRLFDVTDRGNFEGENILHLPRSCEEFAADEEVSPEDLRCRLKRWRATLLAARAGRAQPLRDEKILTSWNGLMIATLAQAYAVTGNSEYLAAATKAADFILTGLVTSQGRLLRSRHGSRCGPPAFLEDYAFFTRGLIGLHQATLEDRFLEAALHLAGEMSRLFADPEGGGLFDTGNDVESALVRLKGDADGVIPSGNAVAAQNLIRLGRIVGEESLVLQGDAILRSFGGSIRQAPVNHLQALEALDLLGHAGVEITCAGDREQGEFRDLLHAIHRRYLPDTILRYRNDHGVTVPQAYLCAAGSCRPPVSGAEGMGRLLDDIMARG